jgi:hypothetical protein
MPRGSVAGRAPWRECSLALGSGPWETLGLKGIHSLIELAKLYQCWDSVSLSWPGNSLRALPLQEPTQVLAHTKCSINVPSFGKQMSDRVMNTLGRCLVKDE